MSKRRRIGDRVWVKAGAGHGASRGEWATITNLPANAPGDLEMCGIWCGDDDCMVFAEVRPEQESEFLFFDVSECEMFDEPQLEQSETEK